MICLNRIKSQILPSFGLEMTRDSFHDNPQ
jgi:hypothetical protein